MNSPFLEQISYIANIQFIPWLQQAPLGWLNLNLDTLYFFSREVFPYGFLYNWSSARKENVCRCQRVSPPTVPQLAFLLLHFLAAKPSKSRTKTLTNHLFGLQRRMFPGPWGLDFWNASSVRRRERLPLFKCILCISYVSLSCKRLNKPHPLNFLWLVISIPSFGAPYLRSRTVWRQRVKLQQRIMS